MQIPQVESIQILKSIQIVLPLLKLKQLLLQLLRNLKFSAIAQVNLTQSQTITALTLEVSNLKTNLTDSITATQTDLINRADQLAQDVTDITVQLTQDKATFTQEIQDALDFLKDDASVASALRTPRKINGTDFDGSSDITTDTWGATRSFKMK